MRMIISPESLFCVVAVTLPQTDRLRQRRKSSYLYQKELRKSMGISPVAALTGLRVRHDVVALSPGQARRAASGADWNGVICVFRD
jgi:hypothetical protein